MRIPHVHKLRLENAENIPSAEIDVNIQPEAYLDDLSLFEDKKEYIKFMIRLKFMVRHSLEYIQLIDTIKRRKGLDHCGIHPNLKVWNGFRIEIHHTPYVLEDICDIVIRKRLNENESMKMGMIAKEVIELHYLGLVGLYPLCELCHHFCHSDSGDTLFIPLDNVFGDPVKFTELYGKYLSPSMKTKWDNIQTLNKSYTLIENTLPVELQKKYIYVKTDESSEHMGISTNKLIEFVQDISKK